MSRSGAEAGSGSGGRSAVVAERLRRFVTGHDGVNRAVRSLARIADRVPGPLGDRLQGVKRRLFRETPWVELLVLIEDLDSQGIGYWLAGGWGVDALLGRRTRPHRDIDIVIDDFPRNEPRVRTSLAARGFDHVGMDQGGIWMPTRSNFEDRAGHRIELLDIDWGRVGSAINTDTETGQPRLEPERLVAEVLTTGSIEGRRVPCLSAAAQLLFHTGFYLEETGSADVSLLRSELGMPT